MDRNLDIKISNNDEKRKNTLDLAKKNAIKLALNDEKKLAKNSFLNDCIKNNLYQKDIKTNLIKYTKDEDITEFFFNDFS